MSIKIKSLTRAKLFAMASLLVPFLVGGCGSASMDPSAGAPPPLKVESVGQRDLYQVDQPEKYALAAATAYRSTSSLKVTASVTP